MPKRKSEEPTAEVLQPFVFYSYTDATARLRISRDERDGSLVLEGNLDGLAKLAEHLAGFAGSRGDRDHDHWINVEGDFRELTLEFDEHLRR